MPSFGPNYEKQFEQFSSRVNAERDRRMGMTFVFDNNVYDCDQASLSRITAAAALAGFAIGAGAQKGFLNWNGEPDPFLWITADNRNVPMDAQTCFAFGQAAARNQSAHVFAGKALKQQPDIYIDITDDAYWPPVTTALKALTPP